MLWHALGWASKLEALAQCSGYSILTPPKPRVGRADTKGSVSSEGAVQNPSACFSEVFKDSRALSTTM